MALEFTIHAMYGTGRRYTTTPPRKINRAAGNQPWGKEYTLNWPYVRYHRQFNICGMHSRYPLYVARCNRENLNPHDKHMWAIHGYPTGPI